MADATSHASWIDRLRSRKSRRQTDWADLGTAYGLDLSMEPTSTDSEDVPAPVAGTPARRWWQRRGRHGGAGSAR